ncbi:hypothetical protein DSO57_1038204 [Entomophthora muscae]|uniref:Uncharacterized protein n=1 Tax=Entomophthora muscae TaxID=34485 RepID=A0ACC2RPS2_9FUNG|nr:hypothetical protein DSO57_1038204 [Entomophthora muscae]
MVSVVWGLPWSTLPNAFMARWSLGPTCHNGQQDSSLVGASGDPEVSKDAHNYQGPRAL